MVDDYQKVHAKSRNDPCRDAPLKQQEPSMISMNQSDRAFLRNKNNDHPDAGMMTQGVLPFKYEEEKKAFGSVTNMDWKGKRRFSGNGSVQGKEEEITKSKSPPTS
jgi:hypothetical protein